MAKLNKITLNGDDILLEQLSKYIPILEPDENGNLNWRNIQNSTWTLLPPGGMLGGYNGSGDFVTSGFSDYNKTGNNATDARLNTIRIITITDTSYSGMSRCYIKMLWFAPDASTWNRDSIASGIMLGVCEDRSFSDTSLPGFSYISGLVDCRSFLVEDHNPAGQWVFSNANNIPKLASGATPSDARHIANKSYVDSGDLLNASNCTYIITGQLRYDMSYTVTNSDTLASIQAMMDDYYPKYKANANQAALIFGKDYTTASNGCDIILRGVGTKFYYVYPYRGPSGSYIDEWGKTGCLNISGSWSDANQKYTVSGASISISTYTPTYEGNPANKKYVDDKASTLTTYINNAVAAVSFPSLTLSDTVFELFGNAEGEEMETTDVETIFTFVEAQNIGDGDNAQIKLNITDHNNANRQFVATLHRSVTETASATTDAVSINCYDSAGTLFTIYASTVSRSGEEDELFGAYDCLTLVDYLGVEEMVDYYATIKSYTLAGLEAYDSSETYNEGDYVYNEEDLLIYKCNTDNTTGSFDSTYWDEKTYMQYMGDALIGSALGGSY